MRAVWMEQFGGPEVLVAGEAPEPDLGPGQVLIEAAVANITFVETQFRATGAGPFLAEPPMILGNGVGGVVVAAASDVDPAIVGKIVVSSTGGSGGYAERVAVAADGVIAVPAGVGLEHAVALMADGRTATMLVQAAALHVGDRVLVEAAAGGVGTLLVQFARHAGAIVVAAAGGQRKLGVALELGADHAVDYTHDDWPALVRAAVGAIDVVFDGVGGTIAAEAFGLVADGGRMVSFGMASGAWAGIDQATAAARGVTLLSPRPAPNELRAMTESALREAASGRLRPVIGQRFPLEQAAAAHAAIEARTTIGKTLLII